jgi:hypothetical protein
MLQDRTYRYAATSEHAEDAAIHAGEAGDRLFEHLISETHATAVGVAVVATAANALNDWRSVIRACEIARFAPDDAPLRMLLPVLVAHDAIDAATTAAIKAFLADLAVASSALDAFLDDCEAIMFQRAAILHARSLQASWRALARETKTLMLDLEHRSALPLPDLHGQNARVVAALLSGAANGLKPCLDDAGRLYVPPLPQKRRSPRRAVLQNCLVHGPHQLQTGFVRDVSAGGLGLGRIAGLKRGDRVRVDFLSGRQFHGTIAWVTGASAGMRFDAPLSPGDALVAV